ncbi:hypothetical protein D7X25_20400 [bacterium 1XD42-8]|nr:hypothetical protein [Lachnospiraceae bacterium]RKJ48752.1 hypothetical protein D7X25_20400 [bacterium 1XD42-8]
MTEEWLLEVGCTRKQAKAIQRMYENSLEESRRKGNEGDKGKKWALKSALLKSKGGRPYDVDLVAGLFDMDAIQINERGEITEGFQEQEAFLRKDKGYLFEPMEDCREWCKSG